MNRIETTDVPVPVLVVGAGPAGLVTAITLARHGIPTLTIERRTALGDLPRATAVSMRTMELVRAWGLEDQVRMGEIDVEWQAWFTETLASGQGMAMSLGYPSREAAALVSPTAPACVPQDHLEPVLLDYLRSFTSAEVRFGTELLSFEKHGSGVAAVVRQSNGRTSTIRAGYVVAADGTHSTVRAGTGIPMEGPDNLEQHVTAQFRAPLWEVVGERRYGIYIVTDPRAGGVFVPAGADDRWLYAREPASPEEDDEMSSPERVTELIRIAAGVPTLAPAIERIGRFSFAAQVATRYREGRVFLAGDAAHRITPRGGTGMNTAIQDGHDLGWKLAWVLKGWATADLLDTYEQERRPIGVHNTVRSAEPDGSFRDVHDRLGFDLAGRLPHHWLRHEGRQMSTLDLLGPGFTLLSAGDIAAASQWRQAVGRAGAAMPVDVHELSLATATVLGIGSGGAVLVRPDGQTAGWWRTAPQEPAAALRLAVAGIADGSLPKAA